MPDQTVRQALDLLSKSHPWHGVELGPEAPRRVYGRDEAFEVIRRSQTDYRARFGAFHRALETGQEERS